jgi:hypothetical protein
MQNPFPGMNPYLEQPELWHQVHNRLIIAIADDLTPRIAPEYRVSIEERIYTSIDDSLVVGVADIAVARRSGNLATLSPETLSIPTTVQVPMPEQVTERYLEIRATASQEVVCVIEILSPKNKRPGEGRTAYESKRLKILASATHLIEIDLLRAGEPIPVVGLLTSGYHIMVSRSYRRPNADLYTASLQERLPTFPIPLRENQPEPVIDLQVILNDIYQRARFDLAIDYTKRLKPALFPEDTTWMKNILNQ